MYKRNSDFDHQLHIYFLIIKERGLEKVVELFKILGFSFTFKSNLNMVVILRDAVLKQSVMRKSCLKLYLAVSLTL